MSSFALILLILAVMLFLLLFPLFSVLPSAAFPEKTLPNLASQRYQFWAQKAVGYLRNITCQSVYYAIQDECEQMKSKKRSQMNVYSAEAPNHSKLIANLPDGSFSRSAEHDGLVAIDPFPEAAFGHLLLVFFVDRMPQSECELRDGIFIGKPV